MATAESLDDVPDPTAPRRVARLVYFRRAYQVFVYWPAFVFLLCTTSLGLVQLAALALGPRAFDVLEFIWAISETVPLALELPLLVGPATRLTVAICTPSSLWRAWERTWFLRLVGLALVHPSVAAVTSVLTLGAVS